SVGGWQSCSDPCAGLDVRSCKSDPRCQATYDLAGYRSCHAVPIPFDPCAAIDPSKCDDDSRCSLQPTGAGCDCAAGVVCDCPPAPPPACGLKACGELTDADACDARPDCTTQAPPLVPTPVSSGGVSSGTTQPQSSPTAICFPLPGCQSSDENDCAKRHECEPKYDGQNHFGTCGSASDCGSAADCAAGQRCNGNHRCVAEGCAGDTERECNADPRCEPVYSLDCSPYANGGGSGFASGVACGGATSGGAAPLPQEAPGSCSCEPSFSSCQPQASGCDPGKSVLVRDPAILDDPYWSLSHVLGLVSGADASAVADAWLAQLATTITVDGRTVSARTGAAQFFAQLPHRADGLLDATKLGFVPTALSNRMDLADTSSCGEARITYAQSVGSTDRRHRMTVIVELRQPYDGNRCRTSAQAWLSLGKLDGAALQSALQALYAPLVTPTNLEQIRTNEFLVGPQDPSQPNAAWELREFHLGADARLHQALLPLQVDPAAVKGSADFLAWAQSASDGLLRGTLTFPAQYQAATASEDGSRIALTDGAVADIVNRSTCAGCHTTATNSAFAHVAERFGGTGRAEISQFLEGELQKRASHLVAVASGVAGAALAVRPLH
ncbi:MAG: hypothetical protein LC659_01505, partial [Myxococcales bacterium]|nr:hypothetical protein [Myxococcales bacterium]